MNLVDCLDEMLAVGWTAMDDLRILWGYHKYVKIDKKCKILIAKSHTSTTDAVTLVLERHFIGQILRQVSGEV